MADDFKFKLELDTSTFVASLDKAKLQTQAFANEFKKSSDAASSATSSMKAALAQMVASGKGGSDEAAKLRDNIREATKAADSLADAAKSVDKEFEKAGDGGISGLAAKFKEGQAAASSGGGMFGGIASSLGSLVSPAGLVAAGIAGVAAAFTLAMDVGQEFQNKSAELSAVTGQEGAALEDLQNRARNLAKEFGGSASSQLESFTGILSKIGPQLADTPAALTSVANSVNVLSKASGDDAKTSMENLTAVMLQFGVNVNDPIEVMAKGTQIIDELTQSANIGSASISDVAQSMQVVGGTAYGANISMKETNAAIQTLAKGSILGAEAGNSLKNVLLKMQSGSKEAEGALFSLGTNFADLGKTVNTEGITAAVQKLANGMKNLGSDAERTSKLAAIFGSENIKGAQALINNVDSLKAFGKGMEDSAGKAQAAANIRMATLSEQMSRGKAAIEDFALGLYQKISPALSKVADLAFKGMGEIADAVGGLWDSIEPIIMPIVELIGGVLVVAWVNMKNQVVTVIDIVTNTIKRIGEVITPVFDDIKKAIGDVGSNLGSFDEVLSVLKDFYEIIEQVASFVVEVFVTAIQAVAGAIRIVISYFTSAGTGAKDMAGKTEQGSSAFGKLHTVLSNIKGTIGGVVEGFKALKDIVGEAINAIAHLDLSKLSSIFGDAGKNLGDAYNKGFNEASGRGANGETGDALLKAQIETYNKIHTRLEEFRKQAGNLSKAQLDDAKADLKKRLDAETEALIAKNALNKDQAKSLQEYLDSIGARGTGKAGAAGDDDGKKDKKEKSAFELAKAQAGELKDAASVALKQFIDDQNKSILAQGRFEANELEKRAILEKELELQRQLAKDTDALFKKDGKIKIRLDASKGESTTDVNKIITDVESTVTPIELKLAANNAKTQVEQLGAEINLLAYQLNERANVQISATFDPVKFTASYNEQRAAIEEKLKAVEVLAKAGKISDSDASKLTKELNKALADGDKDYKKTKEQFDKDMLEARLAGITDAAQREIEIKVAKLIEQRDKELTNALLTEEQKLAIVKRYQDEIDAVRAKGAKTTKTGFDGMAESFADMLKSELEGIKKTSAESKQASEKKIEEVAKERDGLNKQLASRTLSYQDYNDKLAELDKKAADASAGINGEKNATIQALQNTTNKVLGKALVEESAKQAKLFTDVKDKGSKAYEGLAKSAVGSFAAMVVSGKNTTDALKQTAIDTIGTLIDTYIPGIIAGFLAFLGPFALPAGLAAAQLVKGLFASAIGGFATGVVDLQGAGSETSDSIPAWLSRGESVVTARGTRQPGMKELLSHVNRGGDLSSWVVNNHGHLFEQKPETSYGKARDYTVDNSGLLRSLLFRLERIERNTNAIGLPELKTVRLDVKHDPSLAIKALDRQTQVRRAAL